MPTPITAITLSKRKLELAAAQFEPGQQPKWRMCTKIALPASADPLTAVERFCASSDLILVHQPAVRSMLLRRFAHDTVLLVSPPHVKSRALWSPLVPKDWAAQLLAQWQAVDLVYTHVRRANQARLLPSLSASVFFDQFKYRPSRATVAGDDDVLTRRPSGCEKGDDAEG